METIKARYNSSKTAIYACCPFCTDAGKSVDTKFHLLVVPEKFAVCFRCDHKMSYSRFIDIYRMDFGRSILQAESRPKTSFSEDLKKNTAEFNKSFYSTSAINYLHKRGVTNDIIDKLNMRSAVGLGISYNRLVDSNRSIRISKRRSFQFFPEKLYYSLSGICQTVPIPNSM